LVDVIKQGLYDSTLEIASHSWNNSPMKVYTKEQQDKVIKDTNEAIHQVFGIFPKVFIPPENVFDETTIDVLKANGFTHLSSSFNYDTPPFELENSEFYRFPKITETAKLDVESNVWINENRTKIFNDIKSSMSNHGYAVVMMHPPDFSIYDRGIYKNEPDPKQISELGLLIDDIQNIGYSIVPISQINLDSKPTESPKPVETSELIETPEVLPAEQVEPPSKSNCNCVAFRVDGIQDFWLNTVQIELLKTLEENNVDVTVGVLGKFLGEDPSIISQLNSIVENNEIQIRFANMGWEFIDHTQFDVIEQSSSIKNTNDKISQLFSTSSEMFIPPLGEYDSNTLLALEQNNIRYLSSNTQDSHQYAQKSAISHIPMTISGTDLINDDPLLQGTISEKALEQINSNLEQYGFSVISVQFTDFAKQGDQNLENEINTKNLENFVNILEAIKINQIKIVTMDQIPEILSSQSLSVPEWIKNNARWWSEGTIDDTEFKQGIQFLIKEKIIHIEDMPSPSDQAESDIPDWIKQNARWWADGIIYPSKLDISCLSTSIFIPNLVGEST